MHNPVTQDGRYFVVNGRLWRCSNPALPADFVKLHTKALMDARRDLRGKPDETVAKDARARVHAAKVALGERGPVWWKDGAPDYNRRMAVNSPYAEWFAALGSP